MTARTPEPPSPPGRAALPSPPQPPTSPEGEPRSPHRPTPPWQNSWGNPTAALKPPPTLQPPQPGLPNKHSPEAGRPRRGHQTGQETPPPKPTCVSVAPSSLCTQRAIPPLHPTPNLAPSQGACPPSNISKFCIYGASSRNLSPSLFGSLGKIRNTQGSLYTWSDCTQTHLSLPALLPSSSSTPGGDPCLSVTHPILTVPLGS